MGINRLPVQLIRWYQKYLSPLFGRRCRYHPTCSSYAITAIERFGALKGGRLAAWRLLRCNPFTSGGIDDVPKLGIETN